MPSTIPVAHDFICPWCWVGWIQARKLQQHFDVQFDWRGYELFPDELEWPASPPMPQVVSNRPKTLSRFEFLLRCDGLRLPEIEKPKQMRTHNAHEAVEFAKTVGCADDLIDALYAAYWEKGLAINEPEVLAKLSAGIVPDVPAMLDAITSRKFAKEITGFDLPAYQSGVYNVPTFMIGDVRYAEQPYEVLFEAIRSVQPATPEGSIYASLSFPEPSDTKPYVVTNMVATIDGKTVSGTRDDDVLDLGSKADHRIMRRIERHFDAVMLGAQTLRASPLNWSPHVKKRLVWSKSGVIPEEAAFVSEGEVEIVRSDDLAHVLSQLRAEGVRRLLVLGGSELNAALLTLDAVDEVFLTIAPKIKLGRSTPTYAGGEPLGREEMKSFTVVEHHQVGDEVFLRYRRDRER